VRGRSARGERSLYDEDGIDGPWERAMEAMPEPEPETLGELGAMEEMTMNDEATEKTTEPKKPIPGDAILDEVVKLIANSRALRKMGLDKRSQAEMLRAAGELLGDAWRTLKEEARAEEAAAAAARKSGG
jgi:hypothetical protein